MDKTGWLFLLIRSTENHQPSSQKKNETLGQMNIKKKTS